MIESSFGGLDEFNTAFMKLIAEANVVELLSANDKIISSGGLLKTAPAELCESDHFEGSSIP